jgi:hypothetical protein
MAIEQRIGRIDRIGQTREVFVFNLVTCGTLEEQMLHRLDEKISMFELVGWRSRRYPRQPRRGARFRRSDA